MRPLALGSRDQVQILGLPFTKCVISIKSQFSLFVKCGRGVRSGISVGQLREIKDRYRLPIAQIRKWFFPSMSRDRALATK